MTDSLIDELPGVVEIDKAIAEPTRDIAWSGTNAKQQARSQRPFNAVVV
jgi:hypothetical protein